MYTVKQWKTVTVFIFLHPVGYEGQKSDLISSLFDIGGIFGECSFPKLIKIIYNICLFKGGILTGLLSDFLHARAFSCTITLLLSIPSVSVGNQTQLEERLSSEGEEVMHAFLHAALYGCPLLIMHYVACVLCIYQLFLLRFVGGYSIGLYICKLGYLLACSTLEL